MKQNIKNILILNTGGGIGDAIQYLKLFKIINKEFKSVEIYYYSTIPNFWFKNTLKSLKPKNLIEVENFPAHFGFKLKDILFNKNKFKNKFDLIIDAQTRIKNTIIYRRIPHKIFISFSAKGVFSNPPRFVKKERNVQIRFINFFENFLQKKINYKNIKIGVKKEYENEVSRLINTNKKYIGFSIKAGNPKRIKEFNINEIIKTAIYFKKKKFIPTFFLEKKFKKIINKINKKIPDAYYPEHKAKIELQNPSLVIALGKKMEFNITIDNGVMHMLGLSEKKLFCFFNKNSEKFKPLSSNTYVYDCKKQGKVINSLKSKEIIQFINNYI